LGFWSKVANSIFADQVATNIAQLFGPRPGAFLLTCQQPGSPWWPQHPVNGGPTVRNSARDLFRPVSHSFVDSGPSNSFQFVKNCRA
jgi:hypothetical protein